jgi:hypothetical protein
MPRKKSTRTYLPDFYYEDPEERNLPPLLLYQVDLLIEEACDQDLLEEQLRLLTRAFVSIHGLIDDNNELKPKALRQIRQATLRSWPRNYDNRFTTVDPERYLINLEKRAAHLFKTKNAIASYLRYCQDEIGSGSSNVRDPGTVSALRSLTRRRLQLSAAAARAQEIEPLLPTSS